MVRALVELGVSIDVATTDDDGPGRRMNVPIAEPVRRDSGRYFFFPKQTEFYKTSWAFRSWIRKTAGQYDLIHIHALFSFTSVVAARAARRKGMPYIIRPVGVLNRWGMRNRRRLLKQLSFRFVEAPVLRHAAAIHYTSEQERAEAQSIGVRTRSFVIPIGIDMDQLRDQDAGVDFLKSRPQLAGREIVLFLSRINQKKGLDPLLEALSTVVAQRPTVCLVVAGSGAQPYIDELRSKADQLGLNDHIVWSGFLEGREKTGAFSVARVFVLPSYSENFGIAAVEALAAGVPSVITEGVGVADEVQRAEAALVVRPQAAELAAAMLRILSDEELSRRLSATAKAFAQERYSIKSMGESLIAMYQTIVGSK
jgi:glycosyltransferase involved in cell wall biosynthesis